jgi:hypothetical protein
MHLPYVLHEYILKKEVSLLSLLKGIHMTSLHSNELSCNRRPGQSRCLKKIEDGACPTADKHICCSLQFRHATAFDLRKVQHDHFMQALREGKHLKPFPEPTEAEQNEVL